MLFSLGTQRRTRHRRMTTVSSTSSFRRRRRRRRRGRLLDLLGRRAAGRGTTFGAGCAAQRAASAPSPPHLHSMRALSAIDPCCFCARAASVLKRCACTDGPGVESEPIASAARARQGARRRSAPVDGKWRECCQQICRPRAQHASVVSARARAGPTRESDRSSSVARARYAEARFSCTVVFAVIFECRVHEP